MAFPFRSDGTFLRVVKGDLTKRFGIAGIPWDGCVTNRPGARFGPRGIRESSLMLCDGIHPLFDCTPDGVLADFGDFELPNTSLVEMRAKLQQLVTPLLSPERHMVFLGGDHSVTLSLLRCMRAHVGKPLAVIHFDAHCDTWHDHFGEPSGHGTWVYEAIQEGLVMKECTVQLGIRSSGDKEAREYVATQGGMIFSGRDLRGLESPAQIAPIVDAIAARFSAHGNPPVYLTFDIDAIDPAFAPGTGTPEPGGLSSRQALSFIEEFHLRQFPFVGMDCVEVAPPYDTSAALTTQIGAHLVWTHLSGMLYNQLKREAAEAAASAVKA